MTRAAGPSPAALPLAAVLVLTVLTGCGAGASPATPVPATSVPATSVPSTGPTSSTPVRGLDVPFAWRASRVRAGDLGRSWRPGCPVGPGDLRRVTLTYWGMDGRAHTGVLIVHRSAVGPLRPVFRTMFARRFPLRSLRPVTDFGADDDASMAADNTSAFNCRKAVVVGATHWSRHAYGLAVDVNPVENPYLLGDEVLPPAGTAYTDRARRGVPGLIRRGDAVHRAFRAAGFAWGGDFRNPDYQHFERR